MKLITERIEQVQYITEATENGKKNLYITGPFLVYDKPNKNNRLYTKGTLSKEVGRYNDFRLATAADIVADPSAPGAFVNGIMENKEWLFVDGRFVEADIESAKKQIRQASRKDIEQVALTLFENFIRKL